MGILDFLFDDDDEMPYEMKFFVWGRKIEDEIEFKEQNGEGFEEIRDYLKECADAREKYLDPLDLTESEEYYTEKIHEIFENYGVIDPIFEIAFGK